MIAHYLKTAWRNLLKYKAQSIISILGLAIGFTAFAFTMSWIRYEKGYDKHISESDRIFRIFIRDSTALGGVAQYSPNALAKYLKETYPEIEAATGIYPFKTTYNLKGRIIDPCYYIKADKSFFHVFYPHFKIDYPDVIDKTYHIITESTASKLGLSYENIGKKNDTLNINLLGIVPDQPIQSNIHFNIIYLDKNNPEYDDSWGNSSKFTYILLKEGTDFENFENKISKFSFEKIQDEYTTINYYFQTKLVPLRDLRIGHPDNEVSIKFQHLCLFAIISILVIFCAFFNFLMLFVNKIKIRSRALALQKINGASNYQLLVLLFCEFILLIIVAILVGLVLTEILYPLFVKFSMIDAPKTFFVFDAILFGIVILILSVIFAYFPVKYFMQRTIKENLNPEKHLKSGIKDRFTLLTIAIQLIISILLVFSTTIFIYQYNYLNSNYIGFNRFNINSIFTYPNELPIDEIKKIPGVVDVIRYGGDFLPKNSVWITSTEGTDYRCQLYEFEIFGPEFVDFFDINIVEGRNLYEGEKDACLINQTAQRLLSPLDSTDILKINDIPVVGVIQDMFIDSPVLPVLPSIYKLRNPMPWETIQDRTKAYAYKYIDGSRYRTEDDIKKIISEKVGNNLLSFYNMEELYEEYTKSERYLLILLTVMTCVVILIAIFGIYSMITLACNRRRKEIAIRKVNGASIREIFMLFFKQYLWITVASSAVAFPIGVYVMQRWLEQYTRRISMEWWIFGGVFIFVLLIVMSSMIFRVVKAARENPSDVVKSE
ncbi:MAG: ABC transporter permease [Dysgonamonadaceae bacterium]|mgnify:CR=1 FL=1|nr:ABC transporter permease [Fermentimonas sp.]MDD3901346.1 ABC transporter permease [Dysgonamonadaceae bacterium]MDD4399670.1 ABC transporter permease [Dysgonamonadaceae bacterium]